MKYSVVLVPFPFDDLSGNKVRPALCLTEDIEPYGHVVIAFITSRVLNRRPSDLIIDSATDDFSVTGLQVSSTIWLHRLATVKSSIILRRLGELPNIHKAAVDDRLRGLFHL